MKFLLKKIILFILIVIFHNSNFAQDSIQINKLKIQEYNFFVSKPNMYFDNSQSKTISTKIIQASLKDENLLLNEMNQGHSDTAQIDYYRPYRHYFPGFLSTNLGVNSIWYITNSNINKKFKFYIPISVMYERSHYANTILGKTTRKRIDTLNIDGNNHYLDSNNYSGVFYRNLTNRLFLQSGINAETGNRTCKFSAGINAAIGFSFLNKIEIQRESITILEYYNLIGKNDNDSLITSNSSREIVKGKSSVNVRLLTPFSMKLMSKKSSHYGVYGEVTPGFEVNNYIKGKSIFRWVFYASLGIRYVL